MLRYIDMNDTYPGKGGGHPSDMIPAVLAIGESERLSGRDVITAMHVAYEVFASMADMIPLYDYGWDSGTFLQLGAAAGACKALGLTGTLVSNALSMAITPNLPMSVTRFGELSNWKACATAYAAMAGVFAARLAQQGITGPSRPFHGKKGFFDQVGCEPFEPNAVGDQKYGRSAPERSSFKRFPCDFETQIPAAVFSGLHAEGVRPDDIARIDIKTYDLAWRLNGGGNGDHDEKWDPQARETADHSIPYVVAVALTDGSVTLESYRPERIKDPELRPLMSKVQVGCDSAYDESWLTAPGYKIAIEFVNGQARTIAVDRPRGHWLDPVTDDELEEKFLDNALRLVDGSTARWLCDTIWNLPSAADLSDFCDTLRIIG
jgi:2-methylcitrate dehydratase